MKFKDIVVNLVSGAMPSNRVGYYIKRFSQEASVRRLASVLLIGLFIFQSLVFIFPPKASFASGDNDLIPGGIGTTEPPMKQNLTNYVNQNSYGAAFFRLMGITPEYIRDHMTPGTINAGDWKYSMGHNPFGGENCSTRFDLLPEFGGNAPFAGSESVYVGSPNCRWSAGYAPAGLIGDANHPVFIGGKWWQIGVIGDCGNIVLREVPPPPIPSCQSLTVSNTTPLVGQQVTLTGKATSSGRAGLNLADMAYITYDDPSNNSVNRPASTNVSNNNVQSRGIQVSNDIFTDNTQKKISFTKPGLYIIRLAVSSNQLGEGLLAIFPGSGVGGCSKVIDVKPLPEKEISCTRLIINPEDGVQQVGLDVRTRGNATGKNFNNQTERVNMYYTAYKDNVQVGNTIAAEGILDDDNDGIFRDAQARIFNFKQAGEYVIKLKVTYNNNGVSATATGSEAGDCLKQITIKEEQVEDALSCKNLQINPDDLSGAVVPVNVQMSGEAGGQSGNAYVARYIYKVYKVTDGAEKEIGERISTFTANDKSLADTSKPLKSFNFTESGDYIIKLTIQPTVQVEVGGNATGDCIQEFTLLEQKSYECISLTANPDNGKPPLLVNFNAKAKAENTSIQSYVFNYGDGSDPVTVDTSESNVDIQHTYTSPGTYTASFTFVTDAGTADEQNRNCRTEITVSDIKYTKQVANLTQLTRDGQPIDANNVTARAGDVLRYQIGICNASGEPIKGYIFKDNISDLLYYTDLVDTGGGTVKTDTGTTVLEWPAVDVPPLESGQKCVDDDGKIIPENFKTFKEFTVKVKDPVPATGTKQADPDGYDCKVADEFEGNFVSTPINCSIPKIIETNNPLPRTGAGWALGIIGFFAASSIFLFFRNRMLKRELELTSTLTEGMYGESGN